MGLIVTSQVTGSDEAWLKSYRGIWSPTKFAWTKNLGSERITVLMSRGRHERGLTVTVSDRAGRIITMAKWGRTKQGAE
jgi:hypothetical protein